VPDARAISWGLFAAWAVHDAEEVLTATAWSRQTSARLRSEGWPAWLVNSVTVSTTQFAVAVAIVGVAVLLLARHGARTGARSAVFQAAVLVFGWHGLVHVGQAVLLRGYVPGLVGAVLVVIPYSVWAWRATGAIPGRRRPSVAVIAGVAVAAVVLTVIAQSLSRLLPG
jgi:uncharacterized protein with HXXEE motif